MFTSVDYNKKKEKRAQIKFIKDETVPRNDTYKSHTVHVPSGEPPNSQSRPVPKRKEGVVRPITQGKLLKKGGPSDVSAFVDYSCIVSVLTFIRPSISEEACRFKTKARRTAIARQVNCCGCGQATSSHSVSAYSSLVIGTPSTAAASFPSRCASPSSPRT